MNDVDAIKSRMQSLVDSRQEIANSLQQMNSQRVELEAKFQQHNGAIAALQELVPEEPAELESVQEGE